MRVDDVRVLAILPQKPPQLLECRLDLCGHLPHRPRLGCGDTLQQILCLVEDVVLQIVPPLALNVGDRVEQRHVCAKVAPETVVFRPSHEYLASSSLFLLELAQQLLGLYCVLNDASGSLLNHHQLPDIQLLEGHPTVVKLLEGVFQQLYLEVVASLGAVLRLLAKEHEIRLQPHEVVYERLSSLDDFVREAILLPVDEEVMEAFLSAVINLWKVTQLLLVEEGFVGLTEVVPVQARHRLCPEKVG